MSVKYQFSFDENQKMGTNLEKGKLAPPEFVNRGIDIGATFPRMTCSSRKLQNRSGETVIFGDVEKGSSGVGEQGIDLV
jgi:hypothetical protein